MTDRGWVSLVWPIPSSKVITQGWGENFNNYARMGWKIGHSGLDIRTRTPAFPSGIGTPIIAARGGEVLHAGEHFNQDGTPSGYGIAIILAHPDGTRTLYAHLSGVRVRAGSRVTAGQQIGQGGASGNVTGPHLHFELWRPPFNQPGIWGRTDPSPYLEEVAFGANFAVRALAAAGAPSPEGSEAAIHRTRTLDDPLCFCPPFIPEE